MRSSLDLLEPSFHGLYVSTMLQVARGNGAENPWMLYQTVALIAGKQIIAEDPTVFMALYLDIHKDYISKFKAWIIHQTAGDDNLSWLHKQLEDSSNRSIAASENKVARLKFLKETLAKVRANEHAKELFPFAYGKLLQNLEALAFKLGT